jgi:RNA polymerase sigma factor (sigma-70 family)
LSFLLVVLTLVTSASGLEASQTSRELRMKRKLSWQELEDLLGQARLGNEESREELFEFLRSRLLVLARHRVSEAAEDIVHESLIIVHNRFAEFEALQGLIAFTHQVLRNKIGNIYQGRSREQHRRVEMEDVSEAGYHTDREMEAIELERIMRRAIDKLGEKRPYCQSILLSLYQGFEPNEISDKLEITKSKLKVQTFRCRAALKEILVSEYGVQV